MTDRNEDDEIIDTALDTLAWQRREIDRLTAENERLREALVAEREENLWSAYATGDVIGDEWTHLFMSDGEWLAKECGFDPRQGYYSAEAIRNAIPIAARAALGDTQ
jgi:hypothetical protein